MGLRIPMSGKNIELCTGFFLNLECPISAVITRETIANGLSQTARNAGQSRRFYSVAEHSVLVCDLLRHMGEPDRAQWAGLMHDAAEAFIHDLSGPLKAHIRDASVTPSAYDRLNDRLNTLIYDKFEVDMHLKEVSDMVEVADQWAFVIEAGALLPSGGRGYNIPNVIKDLGGLPAPVVWYAGLESIDARDLFRQRWTDLRGLWDG